MLKQSRLAQLKHQTTRTFMSCIPRALLDGWDSSVVKLMLRVTDNERYVGIPGRDCKQEYGLPLTPLSTPCLMLTQAH